METIRENTQMKFVKNKDRDYKEEERSGRKHCRKCEKLFEFSRFGKDKSQRDGMNRFCRSCHNRITRQTIKRRGLPCVYQLFFSDGCTYIGSTNQNFDHRLAVHRSKVAGKIHTNKRFNNYNPENITGIVLQTYKRDDEIGLRRHEFILIKHFKELYGVKCLNAYITKPGELIEIKRKESEDAIEVA